MYATIMKEAWTPQKRSAATTKAWLSRQREVPKFKQPLDAVAWMLKTHKKELAIDGTVTLKALQAIVESLDRVIKNGVDYPKEIFAVGAAMVEKLGADPETAGAFFTFDADTRSRPIIIVNAAHPTQWGPRAKAQAALDEQAGEGWFSSRDRDHVLTHEGGHYAHFKNGAYADLAIEGNYGGRTNQLTRGQKQLIKKEVGMYAATEGVEMVAEVFAGMKAGKKFSERLMDLYKSYGGPL